jgi:hypothetical protein
MFEQTSLRRVTAEDIDPCYTNPHTRIPTMSPPRNYSQVYSSIGHDIWLVIQNSDILEPLNNATYIDPDSFLAWHIVRTSGCRPSSP